MTMALTLSINRTMRCIGKTAKSMEMPANFLNLTSINLIEARLKFSKLHQLSASHRLCAASLPLALNIKDHASLTSFSPSYSSPVRTFSVSVSRFDHYRVLGVRRNASQKDIKNAFYQLSLIFHPDRQPKKNPMHHGNQYNAFVSLDEYQRISVAYSILSNPEKRQSYDLRRLASTTTFDKWRDDLEEWRHRRYHRMRLARERREGGGGANEEITEEEMKEERERRRRASDPHFLELIMGSRKATNMLVWLTVVYLLYIFFVRFLRGDLFK